VVVFQSVVLNQLPTILPALDQVAHFQLERISLRQSYAALLSDPLDVIGMERPRQEPSIIHLVQRKSGDIQSHPVRVDCRAIRAQDHDGLANGIGDRAKFRRFLPELLLGAL